MTQAAANEFDVQRWSAEYEKRKQISQQAFDVWKRVLDQRENSTDQVEREYLWALGEELWRTRCIAVVYQHLAEVREYVGTFGLNMPGLEIPEELFA